MSHNRTIVRTAVVSRHLHKGPRQRRQDWDLLLPIQLRKPGPGFHDRPSLPQKKQAEIYRKGYSRQTVAVPAFEPSPGEEEADGSLVYRVPGLHKEILSLNERGWGSRDKDKEKDKDRQTDRQPQPQPQPQREERQRLPKPFWHMQTHE